MEIHKRSAQMKLRFQTNKGILSDEQLFDLSQNDISNAIKAVKKILKKTDDDELSFLEDSNVVDVENQLRFDILKDVYLTKKEEAEKLRNAADIKANNQKILSEMARRKELKITQISDAELEAMLK